jgi:flagellar protein FliS
MVNTAFAIEAYKQTKTKSTSPVGLVIMLYDGAIEFTHKAIAGINMKELPVKLKYIDKTLAVLGELRATLNMDAGGEVAINLSELYFYMMSEIVWANYYNDVTKLMNVAGLLKELRGAWIEIKDKA